MAPTLLLIMPQGVCTVCAAKPSLVTGPVLGVICTIFPLRMGLCSLFTRRDNVDGRALTGASYTDTTDMTVESCISYCSGKDFIYAGLEYYQECYCGDNIINGGADTTASDCSFPCTGNSEEVCGAGNRLSMYWSGATPPAAPEIVPSVGLWESLGCYV